MAGNAADRRTLDQDEKNRKRRDAADAVDLKLLVVKPEFLRFYGRLLEMTNLLGTVFDTNGSKMAFNAGRQDLGKELLLTIEAVQPDALLEIRRAMKDREGEINE